MAARKQLLGDMEIKRTIFQRNSVLPLTYGLGMIPLNEILQKTKLVYDLARGNGKLNHLLFMDDMRLFTKPEAEL